MGCEFMEVAFRSAKAAICNASFAEQKATLFDRIRVDSQPRRERKVNDVDTNARREGWENNAPMV